MEGIITLINSAMESTANGILDVLAECLPKPMPQSFDWRVVYTSQSWYGWESIFVEVWSMSYTSNIYPDGENLEFEVVFTVNLFG